MRKTQNPVCARGGGADAAGSQAPRGSTIPAPPPWEGLRAPHGGAALTYRVSPAALGPRNLHSSPEAAGPEAFGAERVGFPASYTQPFGPAFPPPFERLRSRSLHVLAGGRRQSMRPLPGGRPQEPCCSESPCRRCPFKRPVCHGAIICMVPRCLTVLIDMFQLEKSSCLLPFQIFNGL